MVSVIQRVSRASVSTDERVSEIETGLLIFLGVDHTDGEYEVNQLAEKIVQLRIFADEKGKMNRSLLDIRGAALVVSQFTLLANTNRGRRPSFEQAAPADHAEKVYLRFVEKVRSMGIATETGVFGAPMQVTLTNSGPVTLILKSKAKT